MNDLKRMARDFTRDQRLVSLTDVELLTGVTIFDHSLDVVVQSRPKQASSDATLHGFQRQVRPVQVFEELGSQALRYETCLIVEYKTIFVHELTLDWFEDGYVRLAPIVRLDGFQQLFSLNV